MPVALLPAPEVVVATLPVPRVTLDPAVLAQPDSTIAKTPRQTIAVAILPIDLINTRMFLLLVTSYSCQIYLIPIAGVSSSWGIS